jgi:hypothetical protein
MCVRFLFNNSNDKAFEETFQAQCKAYKIVFLIIYKFLIDQRLIKFSKSSRYWRKNGSIMAQYISYL